MNNYLCICILNEYIKVELNCFLVRGKIVDWGWWQSNQFQIVLVKRLQRVSKNWNDHVIPRLSYRLIDNILFTNSQAETYTDQNHLAFVKAHAVPLKLLISAELSIPNILNIPTINSRLESVHYSLSSQAPENVNSLEMFRSMQNIRQISFSVKTPAMEAQLHSILRIIKRESHPNLNALRLVYIGSPITLPKDHSSEMGLFEEIPELHLVIFSRLMIEKEVLAHFKRLKSFKFVSYKNLVDDIESISQLLEVTRDLEMLNLDLYLPEEEPKISSMLEGTVAKYRKLEVFKLKVNGAVELRPLIEVLNNSIALKRVRLNVTGIKHPSGAPMPFVTNNTIIDFSQFRSAKYCPLLNWGGEIRLNRLGLAVADEEVMDFVHSQADSLQSLELGLIGPDILESIQVFIGKAKHLKSLILSVPQMNTLTEWERVIDAIAESPSLQYAEFNGNIDIKHFEPLISNPTCTLSHLIIQVHNYPNNKQTPDLTLAKQLSETSPIRTIYISNSTEKFKRFK